MLGFVAKEERWTVATAGQPDAPTSAIIRVEFAIRRGAVPKHRAPIDQFEV
jgi:hypothetical protein